MKKLYTGLLRAFLTGMVLTVLGLSGTAQPTLLIEPQDQFAYPGDSVIFSTYLEGYAPFTIMWFRNDTLIQGPEVVNIPNTGFDIPSVAWTDVGEYYAVVFDRWGEYVITRKARLLINKNATFPYSTSFEDNDLDSSFWNVLSSSNDYGRAQLNTNYFPQDGAYHLIMDVTQPDVLNLNSAFLGLDLTGQTNVELTFWMKDFGIEDNANNGVYISNDRGQTYHQVYEIKGSHHPDNEWIKRIFDIDKFARMNSLDLNDQVVFKFQQYGDNPLVGTGDNDGLAYDMIKIDTADPAYICYRVPPYSTGFENNDLDSCMWHTNEYYAPGFASVITTSNYDPIEGSDHLVMDVKSPNLYNQNELYLYTDLTDITHLELNFWLKDNGTENDSRNGIFISNDEGATWTQIYTITGSYFPNNTWYERHIDLDEAAASTGVSFNESYVIKIQQYDNTSVFLGDGFMIDNFYIGEHRHYGARITPPFTTSFENNDLLDSTYFETSESWTYPTLGETRMTDQGGPRTGTQHVIMDVRSHYYWNKNFFDMYVDATGQDALDLEFWLKSYDNANTSLSGIYLSDDNGKTFTKIHQFSTAWFSSHYNWHQFNFDVDYWAKRYSVEMNDEFVIRFQQYGEHHYDDANTPDGLAFDDIYLGTPFYQATYSTFPYSTGFENSDLGNSFWTTSETYTPWTTQAVVRPQSLMQAKTDAYFMSLYADRRLGGTGTYPDENAWTNLHIDLSGQSQVQMDFWARDYSNVNSDYNGIYLSDDGGQHFTKVYDLLPQSWQNDHWKFQTLDIDRLATTASLSLNDQFVIRFNQFDDYDNLMSDGHRTQDRGLQFDDLKIYYPERYEDWKYVAAPYTTGFENNDLDSVYWDYGWDQQANNKGDHGRVALTSSYSPRTDNYMMILDYNEPYAGVNWNTSWADLYVDLTGQSQMNLSFWLKDYTEEEHASDGVYFSDDAGDTFIKVYSFETQDYTDNIWFNHNLDIDMLASIYSMSMSDKFVIRFQQYGYGSIIGGTGGQTHDGIAIDDLQIFAPSVVNTFVSFPYSTSFEAQELDSTTYWVGFSDDDIGRVKISSTWGPRTGSWHLTQDRCCSYSTIARTESRLYIDLSGETDVELGFWLDHVNQGNEALDGLFFSDDGGSSFTKVSSFSYGQYGESGFRKYLFDVDYLAQQHSMSLNDRFVIKFGEYGPGSHDWGNSTRAIHIDDVQLHNPLTPNYAAFPYSTSFESGVFDQYWNRYRHVDNNEGFSTTDAGRAEVTTRGAPYEGSYSLNMDVVSATGYWNMNESQLFVDVSGNTEVELSFWLMDDNQSTNSYCRVLLSDDGGESFYSNPDLNFYPTNHADRTWYLVRYDIDEVAQRLSLSLNDKFVVKFQQYDNCASYTYGSSQGGLFFDNISIHEGISWAPASFPYSTDFETAIFDPHWKTSSDNDDLKRILVTSYYFDGSSPHGRYHLLMDRTTWGTTTENNADLYIDLSGQSQVEFSWWQKFYGAGATNNYYPEEGIWFSNDSGQTFTQVYDISKRYNNEEDRWWHWFIDVDDLAKQNSITLNDKFVIRLKEKDYGSISYTNTGMGLSFDDLSVHVPEAPNYASFPYQTSFESGMDQHWQKHLYTGHARIETKSFGAIAPYDGDQYLAMHCQSTTVWSLNESRLYLDLSGQTNVQLSFQMTDDNQSTNSRNRILFSNDGGSNWQYHDDMKMLPTHQTDRKWYKYIYDIDDIAGKISMSLNDQFVLKFEQYDNSAINTYTNSQGGYMIDDLEVNTGVLFSIASFPYSTGFEEATWDGHWTHEISDPLLGRVEITMQNHEGQGPWDDYHLIMDRRSWGTYTRNRADLHIDLTGQSDIELGFWIKDYDNNQHGEDGIYFSDDGGVTFTQVHNIRTNIWDDNNEWWYYTFDLDALVRDHSLSLTNDFIIRFNEYDHGSQSYTNTSASWSLDNISVHAPTFTYASFPYSSSFENGQEDYWKFHEYSRTSRIDITSYSGLGGIAPHSGDNYLAMDGVTTTNWYFNEAKLYVDLTDQTNVQLSFWMTDDNQSTNSYNRVMLSDDEGHTWKTINPLQLYPTNQTDRTWYKYVFDLDKYADALSLSFNDQFVIKLQQYDNSAIRTYTNSQGGMMFDDIELFKGPELEYSSFPYYTGFDEGVFDPCWDYSTDNFDISRIQVTTYYVDGQAPRGLNHLLMDRTTWGTYTNNWVDLHIDLSGQSDVELSFDMKDYSSYEDNISGIYFSDDGGRTFNKVHRFENQDYADDNEWWYYDFNVNRIAEDHGMALSDSFIIRIREYDYGSITYTNSGQGLAFDNLTVGYKPVRNYASFPYSTSFEDVMPYTTASLPVDTPAHWTFHEKSDWGRVGVIDTTVFGNASFIKPAHSGYNQVALEPSNGNWSIQDARLYADLSGQDDVTLTFWIKDIHQSTNTGNILYFSDDGGYNFQAIENFDLTSKVDNLWYEFNIDLDVEARAHSLSLTDQFVIKFQNYALYNIGNSSSQDGFIIDDIKLWSPCPLAGLDDKGFSPGESVDFEVIQGETYNWSTGDMSRQITVSPAATTDYYVTVTAGDWICIDTVTAELIPDPTIHHAESCGNDPVTLWVEGGTGFYNWYSDATDNDLVATGDTFITPKLSETTTYYVATYDTVYSTNSLVFDGSNDHVLVENDPRLQITGDMTIEMWIKPENVNQDNSLWGKAFSGEGEIRFYTNEYAYYYYGPEGNHTGPYQGLHTGQAITRGVWSHIALVRDVNAGTLTWYINGSQTNQTGIQYSQAGASDMPMYIGDGYWGTFNGSISEVRVWNKVRTQQELIDNRSRVAVADGLVAYYRMDEDQGSNILHNYLGTGLNGATANMISTPYSFTDGPKIYEGVSEEGNRRLEAVAKVIAPQVEEICPGIAGQTSLSASGGGTYLWSTGGATQVITLAQPAASTDYYVTISKDGISCPDTITVHPGVTAIPGLACGNDTTTLKVNGNPSGFYNWYDSPTGGNLQGVGPSFSTDPLFETTTYYVGAGGPSFTSVAHHEDGLNNYIDLGDPGTLNQTGNMTIEMWINPDDYANHYCPYGKGYGAEGTILLHEDHPTFGGKLRFYYGQNGGDGNPYQAVESRSVIPKNEWTHIAIVRDFDSMKVRIYINGVLDREKDADFSYAVGSNASAYIGRGYWGRFRGELSDFRMWNDVRSDQEIMVNKNIRLSGQEDNLVAYYKLDEGSGMTVYDSSPYGNIGTINHHEDWVTTGPKFTTTESACREEAIAYVVDVESKQICTTGGNATLQTDGTGSYLWNTGDMTDNITVSPTVTTKYYVTVSDNKVCTDSGMVYLPVVTTNDTVCGPNYLELTASSGSGRFSWYDAETGGNLMASGDTFLTPFITATTSYYVASFDHTKAQNFEALSLEGEYKYITTPLSLNQDTGMSYTIEAWIMPTENYGRTIFSTENGGQDWELYISDLGAFPGEYRIRTGNENFNTEVTMLNNKWQHVAVVFDGDQDSIYFYFNGKESVKNALLGHDLSSDNLHIGISPTSLATSSFQGAMAEFRVWDKALTLDEVRENMYYELVGGERNLITYYKFDQDTGYTLVDYTPYMRDGDVHNIASSDWIILDPPDGLSHLGYEEYHELSFEGQCRTLAIAYIDTIPPLWLKEDTIICVNENLFKLRAKDCDTYLWSTGETADTLMIQPTTTTTYYITATKSGYGCQAVDSNVITVTDTIPYVDAGPNQAVCVGIDSVLLNGVGEGDLLWDFGSTIGQVYVDPTVTTVYALTATYNHCKSMDTTQVSFFASNNAYAGEDTTICPNITVPLTAYGGDDFVWSTGESTQTINVTPLDTTDYYVTVSAGGTCQDVDTVRVNVTPLWADAGDDQTVCVNSGAYLLASGEGPDALWSTGETTDSIYVQPVFNPGSPQFEFPYVYRTIKGVCYTEDTVMVRYPAPGESNVAWTSDDTQACIDEPVTLKAYGGDMMVWSTGDTSQTVVVYPLEDTRYRVTVMSSVDPVRGYMCKDTGSVLVSMIDIPGVTITPDTTICEGESISLTASGGVDYQWEEGITAGVPFAPTSTQTYYVTVTGSSGCKSRKGIQVDVVPMPTPDAGTDDAICSGDSLQLTAVGGTSYYWSHGLPNSSYVSPTLTTEYYVTVTNGGLCFNSDTVNITVYENPTVSISGTDINCFGGSDGTASITVSGGASPYSYLWSTGATTDSIYGLTPGIYDVYVEDTNTCNVSDTITLTQPATPLSGFVVHTDLDCNGDADGTVNLNVFGGTTAYTFQWSNGASTEDLSALSGGKYVVTVSDNNNCKLYDSATVYEPPALFTTVTETQVSICGGSDGEADLSISGGTTPYNVFWSSGEGTEDLTGKSAGIYTVTITDNKLCQTTDAANIPDGGSHVVTATPVDVSCYGQTDGGANLSVSGGVTPYDYTWSTGATTQNLTGVGEGIYQVTVISGGTCSATQIVSVSQPDSIDAGLALTDVSTCGGSDGAIDLSLSGGTTPYIYVWSNGASTQDLSMIAAGTYGVTITDNNGCSKELSGEINELAAPVTSLTVTDILCNGDGNGVIDLSVSGGATPYSISWSNGATTEDLTGMSGGTYTVTVQDFSASCEIIKTRTIDEPTAITTTITGTNASSCGLNDGSASLNLTGGISPYSYQWSNGSTSKNLFVLGAGTYNLTVTDQNSCTVNDNVTILEDGGPSLEIITTDVSCNGAANGQAEASVSGGIMPYTYQWSTGETGMTISSLTPGSYTVTLTDGGGCNSFDTKSISQPLAISTTVTETATSACGVADGSADLEVSGGTTPYSYAWSNGATTQDVNSILGGLYDVTVSDANGCEQIATANIIETGAPILTTAATDATCNGASDGTASLTVGGGVTSYNVLWNTGETAENISGLSAATYKVTVTSGGCSPTATAIVNEPAALMATTSATDATNCGGSDGAIDLNLSGGTTPYSYLWSDGSTSEDISSLTANTYDVSITDVNGCNTTATQAVGEGIPISISGTSSPALCNGSSNGTVSLSVSGGSPFSYIWSNGATTKDLMAVAAGAYTVTVTNSTMCEQTYTLSVTEPAQLGLATSSTDASYYGADDGTASVTATGGTTPYNYLWSNTANMATINGLEYGWYYVTVSDVYNCSDNDSVLVDQPLPVLNLSFTQTSVGCNGGSDGTATVSVTGGEAPYTYLWSNGQTTRKATGLSATTYTVTATDTANGVSKSANVLITQPLALDATATATAVSYYNGNDGSINATVTGGTTGYDYLWSNGEIVEDIAYLTPGRYTLTVTDDKGCTDTVSALVNNSTTFVQANVTGVNISCYGNTDGSVNLNVTGGIPPYTYIWSNGETTKDISGLAMGSYTVTVSDGSTQASATASISQPTQLSATTTSSDISCAGAADGGVYLNVTGGTGTKSFQWSNGSNSEDLTGVGTGTYKVTISDANNCQVYKSGTVGYQGYSIAGGPVQYYCADANINLQASAADSYEWSTSENGQNITVSPESNTRYTVTITDGTCTDTASVLIIPRTVEADAGKNLDVCYGAKVNLTAAGGLSYLWSDAVTQSVPFKAYENNTYHVTVTDGYGCRGYDSITVNVKTLPTASFDYDITYGVIELFNYSENATSYSWDFGDGTSDVSYEPVHAYDEVGSYTIRLIAFDDYCGTSDTISQTINIETTSISKAGEDNVFEVYPNPCFGYFTIEFTSKNEDVEVRLFSSGSQVVLEKDYESVSNNTKLPVDITEYASGTYYLKVKVGDRVYVKPILYH